MLTVRDVTLDSFQIQASQIDTRLVLTLSGTADMTAYEPMRMCLRQARDDVAALNLTGVCIDIRSLYLLNSSCIKALVRLVYLAQNEQPRFLLEFLVDHRLTWQARALAPLQRVAPGLVSVT